jgi:hypothetical protein
MVTAPKVKQLIKLVAMRGAIVAMDLLSQNSSAWRKEKTLVTTSGNHHQPTLLEVPFLSPEQKEVANRFRLLQHNYLILPAYILKLHTIST